MPPRKRTRPKRQNDVPAINSSPFVVSIQDIGHVGEGVGHQEGLAVFVPGAVPGDTVLVKPLTRHPRYIHAELLEIMVPSPMRMVPPCSDFQQCGGCQLQHLTYSAQLNWKEERVRQVLARVGGLQDFIVRPIIPAASPWDYRNKAQFPVGQVDGRTMLGFYAQGTHTLVPTEQCLVQHPRIRDAATVLSRYFQENKCLMPYDEVSGTGLLRHVLCRVSFHTEALLITLVMTQQESPELDGLVNYLANNIPNLAGVTLNVNPTRGNRILGDTNQVLWGEGVLHEVLRVGDLVVEFKISAPSFFQVNPVQAQELFATALKYAAVDASTDVLDAYCGTGSITLFLAQAGARRVWGIEEVEEAVIDARANARLNGITNAQFQVGRVEDVASSLIEQEGTPDVLVVDPPRSGLEPSFIEAAVRWKPCRFVYVSCNPATLARDLALICNQGYHLQEVQPVDMFPHTAHIETVVLMSRVEA